MHRYPQRGVAGSAGCRWSDIASLTGQRSARAYPETRPEPARWRLHQQRPERQGTPPMAAPLADRTKALEAALGQIDRQFGKGSVMRLGDDTRPPVEVISTGSIALDVALGIGGLPRGRIIEIYGPES